MLARVPPYEFVPPFGLHCGLFWMPISLIFLAMFWLCFGMVFWSFWIRFGSYFAPFGEVVLGTVSFMAKNGAPHESVVPASQIKGPASLKATRKPPENDAKTAPKTKPRKVRFWGVFWPHFGRPRGRFWSQNAFGNQGKFWMRFGRRKGANKHPTNPTNTRSGGRPGGMRGCLGRTMEG